MKIKSNLDREYKYAYNTKASRISFIIVGIVKL